MKMATNCDNIVFRVFFNHITIIRGVGVIPLFCIGTFRNNGRGTKGIFQWEAKKGVIVQGGFFNCATAHPKNSKCQPVSKF